MVNSGGCRNSEGGANPIGGGAYLLGWQFFPKNCMKLKNGPRGGEACPWRPLGSANDKQRYNSNQ